MSKRKKILWFCYSVNWAYEIRTHNLIRLLPEYDHTVMYPVKRLEIIEGIIAEHDIVICWDKFHYKDIKEKHKIIQCFPGMRMFEKIMENEINSIEPLKREYTDQHKKLLGPT